MLLQVSAICRSQASDQESRTPLASVRESDDSDISDSSAQTRKDNKVTRTADRKSRDDEVTSASLHNRLHSDSGGYTSSLFYFGET